MPAFALLTARTGLALMALALMPDRVMAQQRLQFGGSLGLVEVYDDNLFATPETREPDHIWRLSPRLSLSRRSPRLTLSGRYGLDAETYRRHPSLDTPWAARDASLEMKWAPSSRLVASAGASYAEAQAPGRLNTLTGFEVGRLRGRRLSATGSLSWQMGKVTKGTMEQSIAREEVAGLPRTDTQAASLALERRLGPVDTGGLKYGARRFGSEGEVILSHVVTLGWRREVTPLVHFEVEAGPRLSEDRLGAEVTAGLRYRSARGEADLTYVHTQTTILGHGGPVTVDGTSLTFGRQLLGSLRVVGGPGVVLVQGPGFEATVQRLSLEVAWRVARRLALSASHHFNLQSGGLGRERPEAELMHNTFMLRVVAGSAGN